MTEHGASVAKGEINVFVPVHVGEVGSPSFGDVDGMRARPLLHPMHGRPIEEALEAPGVEDLGAGMGGFEASLLLLQQPTDLLQIDANRGLHVAFA